MTASEPTPTETSLLVESFKKITRFFRRDSTGYRDQFSRTDELNLNPSEVFELLKPKRRQAVLDVLATGEARPTSVSNLAEDVAAIEYGCTPEKLESAQRKRVYIALCQVHLPRLAEAEVVSYDDDRKIVDRGKRFRAVRRIYTTLTDALASET